MTTLATGTAPTRGGFGVDAVAWIGWLRTRVSADWRPGEWDAAAWLFTGSPDNPATSAVRCRCVQCPALLPGRTQRFCEACQRELEQSGRDADEFAATYSPPPGRAAPGSVRDTCTYSRDDVGCGWPQFALGLCLSHYGRWGAYKRRCVRCGEGGLGLTEWLRVVATPRVDAPTPCLVGGCLALAMTERGLCNYHLPLWWRQRRPDTPPRWAKRQVAFLAGNQFSLLPLPEQLRWEVLFALRHSDEAGRTLCPSLVRSAITDLADTATLLDEPDARLDGDDANREVARQVVYLRWAARAGFDEFCGVKPTDKTVFDLRLVDLTADRPRVRARSHPGTADLGGITQAWLRRLVQRWVEIEHPPARVFHQTLRAVLIASEALNGRPGGGHDPAALRFTDMSAVIAAIWSQSKSDGSPYSVTTGANWHAAWFKLLDHGSRAGLLEDLAASFVRDRTAHPTRRHVEVNEDEIGKAVPESVIAQLDDQLASLGCGTVYGTAAIELGDLCAMYQTAYVLLRDTGRRPTEIAALRRDCLEQIDGQVSLIWDNHKSGRLRRRLPITADTAQTVRRWQDRRDRLDLPARGDRYLFPTLTRDSGDDHLDSKAVSTAIRKWVDALPVLLGEDVDSSGQPLPFDRSRIYPYAFRHSYAQRHADAGTPIDVLRELMDHVSIATTAGYYTVSIKRRREAVTKLATLVVDRRGHRAPSTETAYELRSVAVPFGGCTEPSNVQAGGRACPIRFQCAGCGFYRPDPSYLPAIEQHVNELRAGRETARAIDAADFVTAGMTAEITAYEEVATTMRTRLAKLPAAERAEIEQASAVLRKMRAAAGAPGGAALLPLTVVDRTPSDQRADLRE